MLNAVVAVDKLAKPIVKISILHYTYCVQFLSNV